MNSHQTSSNQDAILRIEIYNLLAHLLRQSPSQDVLDWLADLDVEGTNDPHQSSMAAAWPLLKLAAQKATPIAVAEEYQDLFIGIGRGDVVPYGSWYLTGSLMEMPLAHLRSDLKQLGYERNESVKEPEDHIAALLEVMAMLMEGGDEHLQRTFFNRHLAPWCEKVSTDIKTAKSAVFYTAVGELALQFLTVEKTRFLQAD
ncbi:Tat proofreading chaperone DmsD [Photobacterium damselae subsp. piscicida]|uniref:Molecular chaperone n=1 Tax=Photobacterium damsela subsp. piscicida TaxID=38294 RepID=A0A1V1VBR2_PHODP|nr:molecular chaperone [Photobacterium damselae]MBE8129344.1 molecular chaperone [Photobacterium damselae subsp. piscicida]MDP2514312.1 molecular chaperone [Photobacterium damselae subsp. piscicida]MDP2545747.1 molecular chaperone [Photobacterium damselae subsp. piscicida]QOD51529.1 molecular chaperone [Photobacterium damselae subsp. piscicida]QOD55384.1 molecular chaperone [Photobacterium damselae subsp. piscicida]